MLTTGFDSVVRVFDLFSERKYSSKLLHFLFGRPAGMFPLDEIKRLLSHFREIFDENQAKRDGFIRYSIIISICVISVFFLFCLAPLNTFCITYHPSSSPFLISPFKVIRFRLLALFLYSANIY